MNIVTYNPIFRDACIAIFESNMPTFFAPEEKALFTDWLDNHTATGYYVVEKNGAILACGGVFYFPAKQVAVLTWGMVHADHHRQGIGKLFTRYRLELLKNQHPGVVCRIETSQHTKAFYEGLGFVAKEVVKDGFGKGLDKWEMEMQSH